MELLACCVSALSAPTRPPLCGEALTKPFCKFRERCWLGGFLLLPGLLR